ncbi:hypothetical protein CsatB_023053 [Cannabis sativa]
MLRRLGFDELVVKLIMQCVSFISYTIRSGGHEIGPIIPTRGLRQGDPLSPYLFLLCVEGFSTLIRYYERLGKILGCKVSRKAPVLSHMFFDDDCYVFRKASEDSATNMIELFEFSKRLQDNKLICRRWRLFSHLDSLVSKLFKARYYRNGTILNAELGSNPSFVWRSIYETQGIVRKGARCRVSDGSRINVLLDPWLLDDDNPRVTFINPALVDQNVKALMETDSLAWDIDLLHDLFTERDANLILSISLSSSRLCDAWYWSWESSGYFSVKSVYKFLLRSRHVPVDAVFPVCKETDETIYHSLVDCSFAKACWQQLVAGVNLTVVGSFANWFASVLQQVDEEKRRLVAMTCRAIWRHRNELVWSKKIPTVESVVHLAKVLLTDWTRAQDTTMIPTGAFLTDVDDNGTYSFAGVIRDETSALVEAFSCCRSGVLYPEMVETLGVKEALSWIKAKDWKEVVTETNSLIVVQALRSSLPMVSYFGSVISDCKMMLK